MVFENWTNGISDKSEIAVIKIEVKVLVISHVWLFVTPMDGSPPGSSVYGNLQARILECVAIPFSRGSSQPRDWSQVSHTAGRFFTIWAWILGKWLHWLSCKEAATDSIRMWYTWMKFILLLQKLTTCCQVLPSWCLCNIATVCSQIREIKIGKKWL